MTLTLPELVSVRDLQRNYRKLINKIQATGEPIVVLSNNKPQVALVDIKSYQAIQKRLAKLEEKIELQEIAESEQEFSQGKAKKLKGGLLDLIK